MKEKIRNERGSLILETSIVLPIFILVIVFVLGVFNIVQAQNQMTHALVQSVNSLSLDSYLIDHIDSLQEQDHALDGLDDIFIELKRSIVADDPHFTTKTDWFNTEDADLEGGKTMTVNSEIAKLRFLGYLSGGDEEVAEQRLDALGVVDGLDGIDFSIEADKTNVTVTIKYTLQIWADFWGIGQVPMEQTITARMW